MTDGLAVQRITARSLGETFSQIFTTQHLFKILRPCSFEHGLQAHQRAQYSYASGDLILSHRNTEEWVRWTSDVSLLMIALPDSAMHAVAREGGKHRIELEPSPKLEDRRVAALIEAVEQEALLEYPNGRLYLDAISLAIASVLAKTRSTASGPLGGRSAGLSPTQLRRTIDYMHAHMDKQFGIAELAHVAGLSSAYFSERFRRSTGYSPHRYVSRLRVERVQTLLRASSTKIIDVALMCGFATPQHLARVFRQMTGCSPSEYRRSIA